MADQFLGAARALSAGGISAVCGQLGLKPADVWTVLTVETGGCGYLPSGRPKILFERHWFSSLTKRAYDAKDPSISNPDPGGYAGGDGEYDRLNRAMTIEPNAAKRKAVEEAAMKATSWGLGQVMGFNAEKVGYQDVRALVAAALESEDDHLLAFAGFLKSTKLDGPLRAGHWEDFARGYNGRDFAINQYDKKLFDNHAKFVKGPLPDVTGRAVQLYLTFLGYDPKGVDGMIGNNTRTALNRFCGDQGLPAGGAIDQAMVDRLYAEVLKKRRPAAAAPAAQTPQR